MTAFPKKKRIVDEGLLETVRALPCMACALKDPRGARAAIDEGTSRSHPHHLITVKNHGNDVAENVIPLCPPHHRMVHDKGLIWFSQEFPIIEAWLVSAGWAKDWEEDPFDGGYNFKGWIAPACTRAS